MGSETELTFDVVREPWNVYELEDGSILRTKFILLRVKRKEDPSGQTGYAVKSQTITSVSHIPELLIGEPAARQYSPKELQASIVEEDVRYTTLTEEWNEYIVEDGARIRVKLTVVKVAKTDKFNNDGEPIYLVLTTSMPQIQPPRRR